MMLGLLATSAMAQDVVVAAFGDSLTAGFGLPPEDGFVPQLSRWLKDEGVAAQIINAGVSGDTTAGGLSRLEWTLTPEVDALIVALGGNDLLRGVDPDISRANLSGILEIAAARDLPVLLVGLDAPSNYGADFEARFEGMYADLSDEYDTALYPNFLEGIARTGDLRSALRLYMQRDGIHPNADGVALMVEDIGPAVRDLIDTARD